MKFRLVESILDEIYPNKGESKKDFISRFMSVTKGEYPDTKQRYAVANSYWDRKNSKKVNESNGAQMYTLYHGSQQENLSLDDRPIYLTNNLDLAKEFALGYAFNYDLQENDTPTLYTIRARFSNPLVITTEEEYDNIMDIANLDWSLEFLKEKGKDGIIFESDDNINYYMPISASMQCEIIGKEEL